MNEQVKIISGYVLSFITFLLLIVLSVCVILKISVLNKSYVLKHLENLNYYKNISNEIKDDMESYMISSGLDNVVLNDIYTLDEVKSDINSFIEVSYKGEKYNINTDKIKIRLEDNINKYLEENNISFKGKELDEFVSDIINFYCDEVKLYNYLDDYVKYFAKISNYINIIMIVSIILIVVNLFITYKLTKNNYLGSILLSTGLILLFLKFDILGKIDINNIYLITEYFSSFIKVVLNNIEIIMTTTSLILSIIGVILIINNAFLKKNDEIVR